MLLYVASSRPATPSQLWFEEAEPEFLDKLCVPEIPSLGIKYEPVTSGFQGGIRDISTIERGLLLAREQDLNVARWRAVQASTYLADHRDSAHGPTKSEVWRQNLRGCRLPPGDTEPEFHGT